MELTHEEELQAYTDALGGLAIALGFQVDPMRLMVDLKALANEANRRGNGPSAALLDVMAEAVQHVHLRERPKH